MDEQASSQDVLTTTDGETAFFRAVIKHRPRGIHRHFAVIGICQDLERELNSVVSSDSVWSLLGSCYDLDVLNRRDLDVADDLDPSCYIKDSSGDRYIEFQLPIHPTTPPELSFLTSINQRRLNLDPSPVTSPVPSFFQQSRHESRRAIRSGSVGFSATTTEAEIRQDDPVVAEDGMESDLTEQEDLDEEEEDSAPELPKSRRASIRRSSVEPSAPRGGSGRGNRARGGRGRGRGRKKR